MTGYLGKETKLQCNLLGKPTPEIQWIRSPPAPIPNGRHDLEENGLIINSTEIGDTGVYICTAKNKYGSIIQGTYLEVKPVGKYKISVRLLFTWRKLISLSRHTRVVTSHVTRDFHQQDKKNWNFSMRFRSSQQPRALRSSFLCGRSGRSHAMLFGALRDFGPSGCKGDEPRSGPLEKWRGLHGTFLASVITIFVPQFVI